MSSDLKSTFFPGTKKRMTVFVSGSGPLLDKANQRRIKLGLKMSLSDGQLAGMPEWIGDSYTLVAKQGSAADDTKIMVTLDGVNVSFYSTDQTKDSAIDLESCTLKGFSLSRGKEKRSGEVAEVDLYFTLYTNGWVPKLWTWLGDNLNADFYAAFADTNMVLQFVGFAEVSAEDDEAQDEKQGALIIASDFGKAAAATVEPARPRRGLSPAQRIANEKLGGNLSLM